MITFKFNQVHDIYDPKENILHMTYMIYAGLIGFFHGRWRENGYHIMQTKVHRAINNMITLVAETTIYGIRLQKDIQRTPLFHDLTLNNG